MIATNNKLTYDPPIKCFNKLRFYKLNYLQNLNYLYNFCISQFCVPFFGPHEKLKIKKIKMIGEI